MKFFFDDISKTNTFKNSLNSILNYLKQSNILKIKSFYGLKSFYIKKFSVNFNSLIIICKNLAEIEKIKAELEELDTKNIFIQTEFDKDNLLNLSNYLIDNKKHIILSTLPILSSYLPSLDDIANNSFEISKQAQISYNDLIKKLNDFDYCKVPMIDTAGDFSVRGSIIDIWPFGFDNPIRIEFEFNDIISIRYFDSISQRSIQEIEKAFITKSLADKGTAKNSIFDYIDNALLLLDEELIQQNTQETLSSKENNSNDNELFFDELSEDIYSENNINDTPQNNLDIENVSRKSKVIIENSLNSDIDLKISPPPIINSNYDLLFKYLEDYLKKDFIIKIICENQYRYNAFYNVLENSSNIIKENLEKGKINLLTTNLAEGFILQEDKIVVLTSYQIFNKPFRKTNEKIKKINKKSLLIQQNSLKNGDFVVHEKFGIGKYLGLERIKFDTHEQESIKLLYDGGDIVYVNVNYLNLVTKFSAQEGITPQLSNLNSKQWEIAKQKAKKKIKELARDLITLYAKRKTTQGFAFSDDTVWQQELEESFIYEETPDQLKVWEEIKNDMMAPNPMDRLLCGDVGFGKTEIAVRAAFKAVQDGKQVAVLVPTTILAEQHYNTFIDRLNQFAVKICQLSRFVSASQQEKIIEEISQGKKDIVIGTHRILSDDVKFKDLGLLIIDEEHKFGVKAKEKLRTLKVNVDTLTMTATPIPRTLNFSLLGARDLSIIATPPPNRLPVQVSIEVFKIQKVREYILKEISRNGQVFFIHDKVQTINKMKEYLEYHIPEARFTVAHGQLPANKIEKNIADFINHKVDVLIATKIIESGIDIPNANTIIINRADKFGLAELYQLKGRVGRSNKQSYAYFLVPDKNSINRKAKLRLKAIEDFSDLGEGFNVAMRDLEIRGAGNLLGYEQSGVIDNIGFDLYLKMIDEAVNELKNNEFKEIFANVLKQKQKIDTLIDTYFDISIPDEYIPDPSDRVSFYSALFSAKSLEDIDALKEEMYDRFGKIPDSVNDLIYLAILKYYASYALFEKIIIKKDSYTIILPDANENFYYDNYFQKFLQYLYANFSDKFKILQDNNILRIYFKHNFTDTTKLLLYLIDFCKNCQSFLQDT